jgi:predicted extracellular nuclease
MIKKSIGVSSVLLCGMFLATSAQASLIDELFISEYIEGSSFNKAIEIFNGTGADIDLGALGYNIEAYHNGNATANFTINLMGTVADGDVFVLANPSASAPILAQADQTSGSVLWNGDDAVALRRGTTFIDVIGQIGLDPGTQWGTGLVSTQNNTLLRMATIFAGDTDGSNPFDPADQWTGLPEDTFSSLGAHSVAVSAVPVPAAVWLFGTALVGFVGFSRRRKVA